MTSSEFALRTRAERLLESIRRHLDEDYLIRHLDEPIDRATTHFHYHATDPVSHKRFHEVLSRFVIHIYGRGLPCRVRLSRSQARDEAVALLEQLYQGTGANGYDAAVLDARQGQPQGLEVVLDRLTDAIKLRARHTHLQWVFATLLGPADWELRRELAALLLDQTRPWLPEHMAGCTGEQFADEIPALLIQYLSLDTQFQPISTAALLHVA